MRFKVKFSWGRKKKTHKNSRLEEAGCETFEEGLDYLSSRGEIPTAFERILRGLKSGGKAQKAT